MAIAIHVSNAASFHGVLQGVEEPPGFFSRLFGNKAAFVDDLDRSAVEEALAREPSVVGSGRERQVVDGDLGFGRVGTLVMRSDCLTFTMSPTHPQLVEAWMFLLQVAVRVSEQVGAGVWDETTKRSLAHPTRAEVIQQALGQLRKLQRVVDMARALKAQG